MIQKSDHDLIEQTVRVFKSLNYFYDAIIVAYLPAKRNNGVELFHVLYDDDCDDETFEYNEVL